MNLFLKRVFNFVLIFFSGLTGTLILINFLTRNSLILKLEHDKNYVVLGHSHSECAYDDGFIDKFKNVSQSGEAYLYTYLKAEKLIKQNENLEFIFLEFTNNQIQSSMDIWIKDKEFIEARYPDYSSFMSYTEYQIMASLNLSKLLLEIPSGIEQNILFIKNRKSNFLNNYGRHLKLDKLLVKQDLLKIDSLYAIEQSKSKEVSKLNIKYLKKIIELCRNKGVQIVLIRTPFHPLYLLNKNQDLYNAFIKSDFKDVKYLDFSRFQLELNELADTQHLNKWGAERYSKWFNEFLKLGRLDQPTVDSLILIENTRLKALDDFLN